MTTPWSLYTTALGMQLTLLYRAEGNHLRWLGAIDDCLTELGKESPLARMAAAKVGAYAFRLAVARGRLATNEKARDAFVAELTAVTEPCVHPAGALREARGAFLRALAEGDAERIDAALWDLAKVAARAILASKLDKVHGGKATGGKATQQ